MNRSSPSPLASLARRQLHQIRTKNLNREDARRKAAEAAAEGETAPLFLDYVSDPIAFATVLLGLRLCRAQRRILTAISIKRRVIIRSGQKTGKSTCFVIAALWWACTRRRARVIFTAPGNRQVREVLWKELRRICRGVTPDGRIVTEIVGVTPAKLPDTGMQWPDGREIIGFSADTPTATQGFSSPELLVIVDEGSEVPDDIFEAFDGNTAAGGSILAASNPTTNVGWFFEAFHSQADAWDPHHLSSEDTPNCTGEEEPIAGLAGPDWIAEKKLQYGATSAFYLIRVRGEFAGQGSNTIIGLTLLTAAHQAYVEHAERVRPEPLELGVDVARFGDDSSTIAPRRGKRIYPLISLQGFDNNEVAGAVLVAVRDLRRPGEVPRVKIDCTGGHGTGPADILRTGHSAEVKVVEVNSSSRSDDEERFTNLRAQVHFGVAEWLKAGGELPPDKKLDVELLAPTYSFDARRRFVVEPKEKIKQRIRRSPDRADAVSLAIYGGCVGLDGDAGGAPLMSQWDKQASGFDALGESTSRGDALVNGELSRWAGGTPGASGWGTGTPFGTGNGGGGTDGF